MRSRLQQFAIATVLALGLFTATTEGQNPPRLSTADSAFTGAQRISDTGNYFCAETQTPGTAYNLSGATQNAFLATQAIWTVTNGATAAQGTRIYLDRAIVSLATAGTGATRTEMAIAIDDVARYSSGGTAQIVKNTNMDSTSLASIATVFGGDITAAAAGANVRYTARSVLSTSATAVGQGYAITFGGGFVTTPENGRMTALPPVVVGPGDVALVHLWFPGLSAQPTGELMICWLEK